MTSRTAIRMRNFLARLMGVIVTRFVSDRGYGLHFQGLYSVMAASALKSIRALY